MQKTKKETTKNSDWKNLIQAFVGNMLAKVEDNVTHKIHTWMNNFKRKAIASLFVANGIIFLLIGIVTYASSVLNPIVPGLGYMAVGLVVTSLGYMIGKK